MTISIYILSATLPLLASSLTVQPATFIGNVTSTNTKDIRDLGFSGTIGNITINSYGDTLVCGDGSEHDRYYQSGTCNLLSANSAAIQQSDPKPIKDFNLKNGNAQQFCAFNKDEQVGAWGMGITNVVETGENKGVLYFLKNHRPNGVDDIVGGGVAVIDTSGAYPTCTRTSDHWWDSNKVANYGDHSAVLSPKDKNIYVFGGVKTGHTYDGVYVARVPLASATSLDAYEYWDGKTFNKDLNSVTNPTQTQAVLPTNSTQGQITWNPHLNSFLYVYTYKEGAFGTPEVRGKTASEPQGPWSDYFTIYKAEHSFDVYSPTQLMNFDPTGKTLKIGFTDMPNIGQVIEVTFP